MEIGYKEQFGIGPEDEWFFDPAYWNETRNGNLSRLVGEFGKQDVRVVLFSFRQRPGWGYRFNFADDTFEWSKVRYKSLDEAMVGALVNLWKL